MGTVLSVFGLCYLFVWSVVGLFLGIKHDAHVRALESSAKKGSLQDFFGEWSKWKLHAGSHAHAPLLALICIIIGLIMPQMILADTIKTVLVVLLIVGTILSSIAHWFYFKPVLGLGAVLFLVGLFMSIMGFIRGL